MRHTRMDRHAHVDCANPVPVLFDERKLTGERCRYRVVAPVEGGADGVAEPLENIATMFLNGAAQQVIVARQSDLHIDGVAFPEPGAAFDVREQEGHGAVRNATHWGGFSSGRDSSSWIFAASATWLEAVRIG